MREHAPPRLTALLERLGLATSGQVDRMAGRVRRLARDLPRFESIWVDALAQARILTPFQAAEINAGRGESLRVGPYLLCESLPWPEYAASYRACRAASGEAVRLAVVEAPSNSGDEILDRLETLVAKGARLRREHLAPITAAGRDGPRIWAASPWIDGRTASRWMVHDGRFPPGVVLTIARAMLVGLRELEQFGLCHGDVSTSGLVLTESGGVVLLQPGLRAILRPEEGYAHADLPPEAFDYLAPERITDGTPPTLFGDVYSCGCVWWHLLCGRPPLAGGDSLGKLRAAQTAKVLDVCRLAPEVTAPLAEVIAACTDRCPSGRPESMVRLAAKLGPPTRRGKRELARCLIRSTRPAVRRARAARPMRQSRRMTWWPAALACCLLALAAIAWPALDGTWSSLLAPDRSGNVSEAASTRATENSAARKAPDRDGAVGNRTVTDTVNPSPAGQGDHEPSADNRVVPAHYQTEHPPPIGARDLVLATDGPLQIDSLPLRPGQYVRGRGSQRPTLMVPRDGLVVDTDKVRFENVDFVHDHPYRPEDPVAAAAIVRLQSTGVEFHGCTFRSAQPLSTPPAAIRWTHPVDPNESALLLPSGRLLLKDCVLRDIGAGIDCRTAGALGVEVTNTLHLGTGPLVRLDHGPKPDEPLQISLSQVTLRAAGPMLQCVFQTTERPPGQISIRATRCVFVPRAENPLLSLVGPDSPERILQNLQWTGQGSLVSPETVIAAWDGSDGQGRPLDDASVSIAGLVRSRVTFAGELDADPGSSRVVRWQAPLQSPDPPGIDADRLPPNVAIGF